MHFFEICLSLLHAVTRNSVKRTYFGQFQKVQVLFKNVLYWRRYCQFYSTLSPKIRAPSCILSPIFQAQSVQPSNYTTGTVMSNSSTPTGGVHDLRLQCYVGGWSKIWKICKRLWHKNCKRRWVGGKKSIKDCKRKL